MNRSDELRERVRDGYAEAAQQSSEGCCGPNRNAQRALQMGYEDSDLKVIPDEAQLGLGCGNPSAIAELSKGETVLDLGSGAGMDAFLAAEAAGFTNVSLERTDASALFDGACSDPVVAEALEKLSAEQPEAVRRNLWSVRFAGRKP